MAPQTESSTSNGATPVILEQDGSKFVRIQTSMVGRKLDDIIVKPMENQLVVLTKDNEILATFDLPESVDPFAVEADLSEDGVLTIEAPLQC
nr:small heat shock protein [Protodriloides chaetifer]